MTETLLGRKIREARLAQDMSQEDLGGYIGKKQTYISRLELGGNVNPGDDILMKLAAPLGYTFEQLVLARSGIWKEPVLEVSDGVAVRFRGRVPADTKRWTQLERGNETMRVLPEWIGTRALSDCFVVQVSGECLASLKIHDGDYVLMEHIRVEPANGMIVLARIGDEYSLKRFYRIGDVIELRDGEDRVIHRGTVNDADKMDLLGSFIRRWGPADERAL